MKKLRTAGEKFSNDPKNVIEKTVSDLSNLKGPKKIIEVSPKSINSFYNKPIFEVTRSGKVIGRGTDGMKFASDFMKTKEARSARKLGKAGGILGTAGLALTAVGAYKHHKNKKENK